MKKYAILGYDTINIGDDIQSFVASTLVTPSYIINRDNYEKVYDYETGEPVELKEEVNLIMNGWFMHGPDWVGNDKPMNNVKFPIKNNLITPIFISTCLSHGCPKLFENESIEYLKKYSPILCRDMSTLNKMKEYDISAEYFGCLTQLLNIDNVDNSEEYESMYKDTTFFVSANQYDMYKFNFIGNVGNKVIVEHYIDELKFIENPRERINAAHDLLMKYKYAKKIYTTRLHCFLPCISMGLDVEYIGEKDYRTKELISKIPDINNLKEIFYNKIN